VLAEGHATACQRAPPGYPFNLPDPISQLHRVVLRHRQLVLQGKDAVEVLPSHQDKGVAGLRRQHAEFPIHLPDVMLVQKSIGFLQRADPRQA
jgi:hypothetical protein